MSLISKPVSSILSKRTGWPNHLNAKSLILKILKSFIPWQHQGVRSRNGTGEDRIGTLRARNELDEPSF
jgi:hypothetical protein